MVLKVAHHDEVYVKVTGEKSYEQELSDYFTFKVPGYKFMPAYRNKMWDGNIRLFNRRSHTLYACLLYTSPSPRDRIASRMPSSA